MRLTTFSFRTAEPVSRASHVKLAFDALDFDIADQHGGGKEKIFEDSELEALLAEDSCQTQEKLAESLGVTQKAISKCLKAVEMIQKQ